uniref:Formate dehydrogenase n=1 Tax=Wolinella succinogenes TaxID=844 RepID=P28179_WOLSC|nr:formate dehydrogenase [Wolinella succinogenes]
MSEALSGRGNDRRKFLKMSALAGVAGVSQAVGSDQSKVLRPATKQELIEKYPVSKKVKTICTYCSVGCGIIAEVVDGVWVRQEVAQDHPISQGGHCCKGADMIDKARSETRLRYPIEKVGGKWRKTSWDSAMDKIAKQLQDLTQKYGPDSVMFIGGSKCSIEQSYYFRKFAAFFGTNNLDTIARICHAPTVAGVSNTLGYGGMTNHLADMMHSKAIFIIGGNPAVNHPVGMVHILRAKEAGAKIIVVDPHFSRTATKADHYVRLRNGTDVAFMYGMIRHIVKNGLEDKEFIRQRLFGYEEILKECEQYTPEVVEEVTGVPAQQLIEITEIFAKAKPASLIWGMGLTQHTTGTSNTRLAPILQMILGNIGKRGGGTNVLRGHDNVQGATDMGNLADSLPGYYGLDKNAWNHFCGIWKVDFEAMQKRFKTPDMMHKKGFSVSTWRYGVTEEENIPHNAGTKLRSLIVVGSGISTIARVDTTKDALDKMDLVVFFDPYFNDAAALTNRKDNLYILPAATQMETSGRVAATNRSYQWRSMVMKPLFECRPDEEILFDLAKRLGFYEEYTRSLGDGKGNFVWPDDATREVAKAIRTVGFQGRTPERLKAHAENWHMFDKFTLRGKGGPVKGEYYGLPWPCWSEKHPGTPNLWDDSIPVMDGGLGFRVRWGDVSPTGESLLASQDSSLPGSKFKGGHSMITDKNVEAITGIALTEEEKAKVAGKTWATDTTNILVEKALAAGLSPMGNGRARAIVWEWTDQIPKHREPIYTIRHDLISQYPTFKDKPNHFRANIRYESRQKEKDWTKEFPLNMLSGRLVAQFGTGTETRSAHYLAEVQPEMFVEIHPETATDLGVKHGDMVWVHGTNGAKILVKARHSYKVNKTSVFLPQNFGGMYQGESLVPYHIAGTEPYVIGESCNTITSDAYDINTSTPETKCGLCRIEKA